MKHARVKETETKKRGKGFRIFLLVWIVLFVALGAYAVHYVKGMLLEMQSNSVTQIITDRITAMGDDEIDKLFSYNRELEDGDFSGRIREFFRNGEFTLKKVPNSDIYNIYNGNHQILSAEIAKVESVNKLGIFNYGIMEHPISGKNMKFTAPMPKEFDSLFGENIVKYKTTNKGKGKNK